MIYLYRITNQLNSKIYIGVHLQRSDESFEDYYGSGRGIQCAIKKHGRENFKKEIIEEFDDLNAAYNREAEIVTEDFCNREDTYNFKPGGRGGAGPRSRETREKIGAYWRGRKRPETHHENVAMAKKGHPVTSATRSKISSSLTGAVVPEERRRRISESMRRRYAVQPHHQTGRPAHNKGKRGPVSPFKGIAQEIVTCHCGVQGGKSVMKRWHFDNCRLIDSSRTV